MPKAGPQKKQTENETCLASPFLKWAGGKSQLLPVINQYLPNPLKQGRIYDYIEPFIGGGAVFFDLWNNFNIHHAYLLDVNPEIFILYNSVRDKPDDVISVLAEMERSYLAKNDAGRKEAYYSIRDEYNFQRPMEVKPINIKRAAQTIFLNRTCFNGLYRVNSKGHFNVPMGSYKNPTILFEDRLRAASEALQIAEIMLGDFSTTERLIKNQDTFIYYDPPYRPISQTAQFTSYSASDFSDAEQARLGEMFRRLDGKGALQMLSNSDPTNHADDPFFDDLFKGFNISRIHATRRINSDGDKRAGVREILVTNYKKDD